MITVLQLKQIAPRVPLPTLSKYVHVLSEALVKHGITTKARKAAFLAQLLHESGGFVYAAEIASGAAYEGRKDLGNIHAGDGKRFKGRGLIQVTGRANYKACSLALFGDERLLKTPELLVQPRYAVESACWFWNSRKLSSIADQPDTWRTRIRKGTPNEKICNKFEYITYRINGGFNGFSDRLKYYTLALQVL